MKNRRKGSKREVGGTCEALHCLYPKFEKKPVTLGPGRIGRLKVHRHRRACTRLIRSENFFNTLEKGGGQRERESETERERIRKGEKVALVRDALFHSHLHARTVSSDLRLLYPDLSLYIYVLALALVLTLMFTTRTCTHGGPYASSSAPDYASFLPLRFYTSLLTTARIFMVALQGLNSRSRRAERGSARFLFRTTLPRVNSRGGFSSHFDCSKREGDSRRRGGEKKSRCLRNDRTERDSKLMEATVEGWSWPLCSKLLVVRTAQW